MRQKLRYRLLLVARDGKRPAVGRGDRSRAEELAERRVADQIGLVQDVRRAKGLKLRSRFPESAVVLRVDRVEGDRGNESGLVAIGREAEDQ